MEENNKNVIVIQNDDNKIKDPKKLTFSKYWHYVGKFRYWILGLTLFFAIIGYLFSFIYLNPKNRVLTSTFTLNFPLQEVNNSNNNNSENNNNNDLSYTYFDGSTFSYQSIISNDSLTYIINNTFTDSEKTSKKYTFSIEKINDYNAISIQQATNIVNNNTVVIPNKYMITATVKYFGNKSTLAKDFVFDLLKRANDIAVEKLSSSTLLKTLPNSISDLSYDLIISQLSKQYNLINNSYSELEKKVSSNLIFEDNISLRMRTSDLKSKYNNGVVGDVFADLKNEALTRSFYKYDINKNLDDVISEVKIKAINDTNALSNIDKEITDKKDTMSKYNRTDGDSKLSEYYIQLSNELEQLQEQKREYESNINSYGYSSDGNYVEGSILDNLNKAKTPGANTEWVEANQQFNTRLNNYYSMLKTDADKANNDYIYAYKTASNGVLFDTAGIATIDGEINDFIIAAIGLVLGYLLSSIICAYIGNHKDNNKNDKNNIEEDNTLPKEIKEEPSSFVISSEDK